MKNIKKFVVSMVVIMTIIAIGGTSTASAYTLGQTGRDVADLQITLIEAGFDIPAISSGIASPGYFGDQTQKAYTEYVASKGSGITLGAVTGPNVNYHMFLNEGLTVGGRIATTSAVATYTTSEADFRTLPSYLDWLPNLNTTISISATSTHGLVPKIGDVARILIRNASTTAASTITFAALNTNVDLQFSEATGGDLVLNGLDFAELILIREDTYTTTVIFDEFTEAD